MSGSQITIIILASSVMAFLFGAMFARLGRIGDALRKIDLMFGKQIEINNALQSQILTQNEIINQRIANLAEQINEDKYID